jgi:HK97 family phage prohead protease
MGKDKLEFKSFRCNFELKAVGDDENVFEGYASVFGNVDSYGDVVLPGAFKRTLQNRKSARNKSFPVLWQHSSYEPFGYTLDIEEDSHGLKVRGKLIAESGEAKQRLALVKAGVVDGMSFGYSVVDAEKTDNEDGFADMKGCRRKLKELKLYEVTLTNIPANEEAGVLSVKSAEEIMDVVSRLSALVEGMAKKVDELQEKLDGDEDDNNGNNGNPEDLEGKADGDTGGNPPDAPPVESNGEGGSVNSDEEALLAALLEKTTSINDELDALELLNAINNGGL